MSSHQSSTATSTATSGSLASAAIQADAEQAFLVQDFSNWQGENQLGEYSNAGQFATDSGSPTVSDGALVLPFEDAGWFLSNVRRDCSSYVALEIDVRGAAGGEAEGVQLEVGDVEGPLADLADGSIGTELSTLRVDLEAAGVDRSHVQDVWLNFWQAGSGEIEIEEIRFVPEGGTGGCSDLPDDQVATVDGQTVCDVGGDGWHRDVNGDGTVGQGDVAEFFSKQHRDAWKRPELFDFSQNGAVTHGDVVELADYVALN